MKIKLKFVGVGVKGDPRSEGLLNKKAGITLISLVITVIVLLILAGAAVTIALNGDSIFGKANRAVTEWNTKTSQEESALTANMATLNEYFRVTSDQKVIVTSDPVKTNEMTSGSISVSLKYGENNDAIPTDYVMQYQEKTDGTEGEWQNYTAALPYTVTQVATENSGKQVRGRLYNATLNADTGTSEWFIVDWVDRENPSAPTAIAKVSSTDTSITVQASGGNDDSGTWLYEYKIGNEDWSTAKATTETHTFTGLSVGNTYTIQARSKDVAGKYSATTKSIQIPLLQTITQTMTIGSNSVTRTATIPAGFTVSQVTGENTIAGGLVIYKQENGFTEVTNSNYSGASGAQKRCDQYVWIPVDDINSMIMCKSSNTGDAGTIYINGVAQSVPTTKCHIEFVEGELKCTNSAHTANATNLCGRLYTPIAPNPSYDTVSVGGNNKKAYKYNVDFTEDTQTWNTSSFHEPNTVNGNGSQYDAATFGAPTLTQLTDYFNYMARSVATYHGFYVSRYEIGGTSSSSGATALTSRLGQVVLNAGAYTTEASNGNCANPNGTGNWYGLYNACNLARSNSTDYSRGMIWGSQYDQILKFIDEDKAANAQKVAQIGHPGNFQSVTWNNYYNTSTYKYVDYPESGELGEPAMKNVYDLENNFGEWTLSADSTYYRAFRGGFFGNAPGNGIFYPASNRSYDSPTTTNPYISSRAVLLVQL